MNTDSLLAGLPLILPEPPRPQGPYMESIPDPRARPQQPAYQSALFGPVHQFAMQQFLKFMAQRKQNEERVPSWQMPYPMPATQGERDVLGMLPVAGDVEDMRYLMEGVHEGDPAKMLMGGAATALPFVPASLLHTVYHGSPHIFDAFKLSKIGTGEGAQAYGHGLYFAESPGVAREYQSQLTRTTQGKVLLDGQPLDKPSPAQALAAGAQEWKGDAMEALNKLKPTGKLYTPEVIEEAKELVKSGRIGYQKAGAFYKVEIPDEAVGRMLDWDKPLSEQPESVKSALQTVGVNETFPFVPFREPDGKWNIHTPQGNAYIPGFGDKTEEDALQAAKDMASGYWKTAPPGQGVMDGLAAIIAQERGISPREAAPLASERLRQAGIPGIRYFDAMSRGAEEGTRNLVLFDESLAKILERK